MWLCAQPSSLQEGCLPRDPVSKNLNAGLHADCPSSLGRRAVQVYNAAAAPVEDYYRRKGLLVDFEITGGIPETLPRLLEVLKPYQEQAQKPGSQ
jgi:hypothetical protein